MPENPQNLEPEVGMILTIIQGTICENVALIIIFKISELGLKQRYELSGIIFGTFRFLTTKCCCVFDNFHL